MKRAGLLLLLAVATQTARAAGPVDFAEGALRAAAAARGQTLTFTSELSVPLPEEGFQITGAVIRGGSARGLMYGLLEAARQIRSDGRLSAVMGEPAVPLRGVRRVMTPGDWARNSAAWLEIFTQLAQARFNRMHLILDESLTPEKIAVLKRVSAQAQERAVDLAVGLFDPRVEDVITLLSECPAIRSIYVDPNAAPAVSGAVKNAGRYVVLESSEPVSTAVSVPLRIGTPPGENSACVAPCSRYLVFPSQSAPPASLNGLAGVELQGSESAAWTAALFPVKKIAAPAKKPVPARRPAAKRKRR